MSVLVVLPACSQMRSRVVQMCVGPWRGVELMSDTSERAASRRDAATDGGLCDPGRRNVNILFAFQYINDDDTCVCDELSIVYQYKRAKYTLLVSYLGKTSSESTNSCYYRITLISSMSTVQVNSLIICHQRLYFYMVTLFSQLFCFGTKLKSPLGLACDFGIPVMWLSMLLVHVKLQKHMGKCEREMSSKGNIHINMFSF